MSQERVERLYLGVNECLPAWGEYSALCRWKKGFVEFIVAFVRDFFFSFSDRKCKYLSVHMQDKKICHFQVDVVFQLCAGNQSLCFLGMVISLLDWL